MADVINGRKRIRKQFGSIREVAEMPNLIEVQKSSYDDFLMVKEPPGGRPDDHGLQAVFKSVFPISDFSGRATLEFVRYEFEPPKYDVDECMQRDMTFSAPLKVKLRLIVFDVNEETGSKSIKDVKEQDVYMGDMPLMTIERHLRHQRHRACYCLADASFAGRVLRPRPRPHYMRRASSCSPPASFPTAARGSTSSSTPRMSSMSASTGAASCR